MITPFEIREFSKTFTLDLESTSVNGWLETCADRIEQLERALAYYASPANWEQDPYTKPIEELQALYRSTAEKDRGERARTALNNGDEK